MSGIQPPGQWTSVDPDWYDNRWKQLEAEGHNPHGEADFVMRFSPGTVLDAGCGTGRVAIELNRRGVIAAGVDLDPTMIEAAQAKAPDLDLRVGDVATVSLDAKFDAVVMAGNVMIFVETRRQASVLQNMADHLEIGGHLISGFQLNRGVSVDDYNQWAEDAGLTPVEHWASWDAEPSTSEDNYAVIVHRL